MQWATGQGWGQILEKGFKSKSFEIFQIQIKSKSFFFEKDLNPNPFWKRNLNPLEKHALINYDGCVL